MIKKNSLPTKVDSMLNFQLHFLKVRLFRIDQPMSGHVRIALSESLKAFSHLLPHPRVSFKSCTFFLHFKSSHFYLPFPFSLRHPQVFIGGCVRRGRVNFPSSPFLLEPSPSVVYYPYPHSSPSTPSLWGLLPLTLASCLCQGLYTQYLSASYCVISSWCTLCHNSSSLNQY